MKISATNKNSFPTNDEIAEGNAMYDPNMALDPFEELTSPNYTLGLNQVLEPLSQLTLDQRSRLVAKYLEFGAKPEEKCSVNGSLPMNALARAIILNEMTLAGLILQHAEEKGTTKALLRGMVPSAEGKAKSFLAVAIIKNNPEMVELLKEYGIRPNEKELQLARQIQSQLRHELVDSAEKDKNAAIVASLGANVIPIQSLRIENASERSFSCKVGKRHPLTRAS